MRRPSAPRSDAPDGPRDDFVAAVPGYAQWRETVHAQIQMSPVPPLSVSDGGPAAPSDVGRSPRAKRGLASPRGSPRSPRGSPRERAEMYPANDWEKQRLLALLREDGPAA